ncbi:MAG TPA: TIGR04211 family SH3 domain-containing protein [Chromatiales bacterium]|nr:TIGR04211 family SH3 domain-containing protein [Chromatiales bacterium]HEX22150.1 TIGR04211 family SH3 domain-containing protein [Chromatiales bacterium]
MILSHKIHRLLFTTLLSMALPAHAAFITDRIEVPVYAEKHNQGAVLKKLLSGTQVDILMKDGEFARISARDGTSGWVEFKYISAEKPLGLEYLELRSQYKTLQQELAAARQAPAAPQETTSPGISEKELVSLRRDAKDTRWMKAEMSKAREQAKKLDAELKTLRANAKKQNESSSAAQDAVQEELTQLRAQNQDLEARLAAALLINEEQSIAAAAVKVAAADIETTPVSHENNVWPVNLEWFLGSLAATFILGVIGGIRWLDRRIRKKHGGFRIY